MSVNTLTLRDLASIIGVSVSTVSKSLSDSHEISISTKEKVVKIAKSLNYKPNPLACSLRSKRSLILGVILPDLRDHFFLDFLNGITEESYKNEYRIMAYQSGNNYKKEIEYTNLLFNSNIIDGLIYSSTKAPFDPRSNELLKKYIKKDLPIVCVEKNDKINLVNGVVEKKQQHTILKENGYRMGQNCVKKILREIDNKFINLSA